MTIVWSNEAKINYENIFDDVLKKWPIQIALDFERNTNELLDQLTKNRKLCPPLVQYKGLRKCVIHKNVSLIYRITRNNIEIVTFIFNRDEHPFY